MELPACRLRTPFAVAFLLLTTACGGSTDLLVTGLQAHGVTAAASDAGAPGVATATIDAGAPDASDAGDAGDDAALPATNLGNVFLTSGVFSDGGAQSFDMTALFYPVVAQAGCSIRTVDACTITECAPTGAPLTLASAGSVAVSGGRVEVVAASGANGVYESSGPMPLFAGGETLWVTATGADVPAFAAKVTAPSQVTVTAPSLAGALAVDTGAPLSFSWSGASAGSVTATLEAGTFGSADYRSVACAFDPRAGAGTMPPSLVRLFAGSQGALSVSTQVESDVQAGSWFVATFATSGAQDPSGAEYREQVTFH